MVGGKRQLHFRANNSPMGLGFCLVSFDSYLFLTRLTLRLARHRHIVGNGNTPKNQTKGKKNAADMASRSSLLCAFPLLGPPFIFCPPMDSPHPQIRQHTNKFQCFGGHGVGGIFGEG